MMKYVLLLLVVLFALSGCVQSQPDNSPEKITYLSYGGLTHPSLAITELIITNTSVELFVYANNGSITLSQQQPHSQTNFTKLVELFEKMDYFTWKPIQKSTVPIADAGFANITVESNTDLRSVYLDPNVVSAHGPQQQIVLDALQSYVRRFVYTVEPREEPELFTYVFQPTKCNVTQWQQWYQEGNIQYSEEPSEKDVIIAYYGSQNIDIETVQSIQTTDLTCDACGCNETFMFEAESYTNITGWQIKNISIEE